MKKLVWTLLMLAGSALPAQATLVTIDSTNCANNCYGLSWALDITDLGSDNYAATLTVKDDLTDGKDLNTSLVISAVDFKVTSGTSGFDFLAQTGAPAAGWITFASGLNGNGGCVTPGGGFICSQSATAVSVANAPLTWSWSFTTSDPLFNGLYGAHIGAKLTDLNTNGKLLSEVYVPEPATGGLLMLGAVLGLLAARRRIRTV